MHTHISEMNTCIGDRAQEVNHFWMISKYALIFSFAALGLEFASSMPFVSTPTSSAHLPTLLSKTECGFQENSSDSYNLSGGFENSGFRFHGVGNNERTFSSSSNSSNTSFISEGSFNNFLLRNTQGEGCVQLYSILIV